jgi:hypothetical protein
MRWLTFCLGRVCLQSASGLNTSAFQKQAGDNHLIPKTTYSTFGQVRTGGLTTAMSRSSYTSMRDNWRCHVLRWPWQNAPQSWGPWNHASVQFWTLTSNRSNRPLARVQLRRCALRDAIEGITGHRDVKQQFILRSAGIFVHGSCDTARPPPNPNLATQGLEGAKPRSQRQRCYYTYAYYHANPKCHSHLASSDEIIRLNEGAFHVPCGKPTKPFHNWTDRWEGFAFYFTLGIEVA